jgi:hypothetical protein
MIAGVASRISWYSLSVSVWAGATVMSRRWSPSGQLSSSRR